MPGTPLYRKHVANESSNIREREREARGHPFFLSLLHYLDLNTRVKTGAFFFCQKKRMPLKANHLVEQQRACFTEKNLIPGLFGREMDHNAPGIARRG
jgi:hypothetical protein